MNILIVTYIEGTGNYPVYIKDELEKLGNIVHILPTDLNNESKYFQTLYRKGKHLGRMGRLILNRQIHSHINNHSPELLLIYGSNNFLYPQVLRLIKRRGLKVALFEGNLRFGQLFQVAAIPLYDLIIATDSYIIPFLREIMGHKNSVYLTGFGVPSIFRKVEIAEDISQRYGADVSFIGRYFPNRDDFVRKLESQVMIWGTDWEKSSLEHKDDIKYLDPSKKALVYGSSKINLHLRPGNNQINSFSTRIWEVPLCGGFILSEWSKDLLDLFNEDREIVVFRSPGEADTKISYYLQREEERMRITDRLREKIMGNYLLEHTVGRLNELLLRI